MCVCVMGVREGCLQKDAGALAAGLDVHGGVVLLVAPNQPHQLLKRLLHILSRPRRCLHV